MGKEIPNSSSPTPSYLVPPKAGENKKPKKQETGTRFRVSEKNRLCIHLQYPVCRWTLGKVTTIYSGTREGATPQMNTRRSASVKLTAPFKQVTHTI